jgi:hypothetical protein
MQKGENVLFAHFAHARCEQAEGDDLLCLVYVRRSIVSFCAALSRGSWRSALAHALAAGAPAAAAAATAAVPLLMCNPDLR